MIFNKTVSVFVGVIFTAMGISTGNGQDFTEHATSVVEFGEEDAPIADEFFEEVAAVAAPVCNFVPAQRSIPGVSFGMVQAGKRYQYDAMGCVDFVCSSSSCSTCFLFSDADGDTFTEAGCQSFCGRFFGTGGWVCDNKSTFSLVGEIGGGACMQLGTSGSFCAEESGELLLWVNTHIAFLSNAGYDVCITEVESDIQFQESATCSGFDNSDGEPSVMVPVRH